MIHTVKIDDATNYGKHLLQTLKPKSNKTNSGIFIENPNQSMHVPEEYMTIEEFRKVAIEDTIKFCKENCIY